MIRQGTHQHLWAKLVVLVCLGWVGFHSLVPLASFDDPYSTVLYDRNGGLLGATIAQDGQWRFPQESTAPEKFQIAIETFEDKRFRFHPGVDLIALGRALWSNVTAGKIVSGASTLTMQVVRLCRKGQPRTYKEKVIEVVMALRLEATFSKDDILDFYAANAPFGGNVVGLEAAAWRYFQQHPDNLSWAETATLAVLPNSPALIHPGRNRQELLRKRNALLIQLEREGYLSPSSGRLARQEPLPRRPYPMPQLAPHLLSQMDRGSATISTVDRGLQVLATDVVMRHHQQLEQNGVHNAAILILDTMTGEALSYIGNIPEFKNTDHHNYVDVIQAPRSTGSVLKPFLFAAALQSGELLPSQLIADIPTRMGGFAPQNFHRKYSGAVPASQALTRSLNIPAVKLLQSYGVARFQTLLQSMGMSTLHRASDDYGLTLILGGAEGSLWELTGLYASMARSSQLGGSIIGDEPIFSQPTVVSKYDPVLDNPITPLISAGAAYITLETLLEVRRPGVDGQWRFFESGRQIAWKTGTSFGHRDAWAIGVTPEYTVGIWVGNADGEGRPNLTGAKAAAPILFEIFDLLRPEQWFSPPHRDLVEVEVCSHSGLRAGPHCAHTTRQLTAKHITPGAPCHYCQKVHCDKDCQWRVHAGCESMSQMRTESRFILPPAMEWFYRKEHHSYETIPPMRNDCRSTFHGRESAPLTVLSPTNGTQIILPKTLSGEQGSLVVEAAHHRTDIDVYWHLDQEFLGTTREHHQMLVNAPSGAHLLTLVDAEGHRATLSFELLAGH